MSQGSIFSLSNPEIYVVTTAHDGQLAGQVATWVTLASLVPEHPRVIVVLSPATHTSSLLRHQPTFVLNLLSETQAPWLERFGLFSGFNRDKFQGIELTYTDQGLPILPNTCGWAVCQATEHVDVGDRIIWIADVTEQSYHPDQRPLRRVEGLNTLPNEVRDRLLQQRLADIERDRPLRFSPGEAPAEV